jgi:DNA/RNA-binding domain of Phe-tRNA-synthetase-like protein
VIQHPAVRAIRKLFRAAGCDPTRYRPSSEALLRRVLKTGELPAISPAVDLNNILSLRLMLPCCVVDASSIAPPFELRVGSEGESMESLRGPFHLAGKPVLVDQLGPFGTPITDAKRVMITEASAEAWLVAYLASELHVGDTTRSVLNELLVRAPIAELLGFS